MIKLSLAKSGKLANTAISILMLIFATFLFLITDNACSIYNELGQPVPRDAYILWLSSLGLITDSLIGLAHATLTLGGKYIISIIGVSVMALIVALGIGIITVPDFGGLETSPGVFLDWVGQILVMAKNGLDILEAGLDLAAVAFEKNSTPPTSSSGSHPYALKARVILIIIEFGSLMTAALRAFLSDLG